MFVVLLHQVTVATDLSPSFDKWCSLLFAVLSGAAAAAVLLVCPRGLLNIDTTGATRAISHASASVLSQRGWEPDAQGGLRNTSHCASSFVAYESDSCLRCMMGCCAASLAHKH